MGPFMVEIVFCRVTRRGRKKKAGMNKAGRENMRNDGPMQSFIPKDDFVKLTLDLSDNGPVFGALDDMMLRLSLEGADDAQKRKAESGGAKKALKNLLKSGIPGIEGMFAPADAQPKGFGKQGGKKGFHKMNDGSKKKFMTAIFGEDGTQIDTATAAALLAATCSGGNPEIGNRLAELLVPNMGDTVDPTMMAALMSACSLINAGAGTEEVMKAMMMELANSGMSEEEILEKTQLLMKSFGKEEVGSTAEYRLLSKQKNKALSKMEIPPKDFTAIVLAHKAIAACGTTPENVAKLLIILSTLGKKGANPMHVANAMKNLGQISDDTRAEVIAGVITAWEDSAKIGKLDVSLPVRMHMALDNENEPGWTEVKNLKDIVGGVSPNSQEAIELNLARGVKAAGLKKDDIGRANMAMKAITSLGVDIQMLAKIMFLEKTICDNGVPAIEVGRVLSDGLMPIEATQGLIEEAKATFQGDLKPADVETGVRLYNQLKLKGNNPVEIIEYVDKTLIQVRCSLEDVADNMFSTMGARGEKESKIVRDVTETLKKTGASASVVSATIMPPLKELTGKPEVDLTKVIGRNLKEVNYDNDDIKSAVTEMITKIIDEDPQQHQIAVDALTSVFKDLGESPFTIKDYVASNLPPPPTPPEEIERRRQVAEELAKLEREEQERLRIKEAKERGEDPEAEIVNKNLKVNGAGPDSRRGSLTIGGTERRGSYYDSNVTTRASVAVVTDDPENKKKVKESLSQVFDGGMANGIANGLPDGMDDEALEKMLASSGMSAEEKQKLLGAFKSAGVLHDVGGITKIRRPEDMAAMIAKGLDAFDAAILDHQNRPAIEIPQLSPEARELMQKILASNSSQDEISSRVSALLAGTALSSSRGDLPSRTYGDVEQATYDIGDTSVTSKKRGDNFEMPEIPTIPTVKIQTEDTTIDTSKGSSVSRGLRRPSIKRQSELMREARKSRQEEMEEERKRKASYYRRVTGLRKAKVPLMVYSCGGFSRCFRIARFHDVEGPPVGLYYERPGDERQELNPDL